ncbi:MFS transporter [Massilia forsythiae]|uniref:MFS transporter n=1 Tax=Massilia forsythiae TaxID=2728020 RepID=A0A7Z2VYR6_9BURK|nr:MFS transporter [Massilia forsythiae]QJE01891.1 MFS transporter [Massilia forsythiae]
MTDGAQPAQLQASLSAPVVAPSSASLRAGTLRHGGWGLLALAGWLLVGELGIAMRDRWALSTALVALNRLGASDTGVSLILSTLPAVLSLFLVPWLGMRSDRHRGRWGRRRPFLMLTAPIGALAMLGVAAAPALAGASHAALGNWSPGLRPLQLGWFCAFWTVFDCAAVATIALFTGLVNDVMPRRCIGRFYAAFRVVGLGVAIAFNSWLLALTDTRQFAILVAIALIFGLATPLMCAMVREAPSQPAPDADAVAAAPARSAIARAAASVRFGQRRHLWAVAAFMLAAVTFSPFNTFSISYALSLGIPKAELGALTALAYAVSIAAAFGIGWLTDRIGALRLSSALMGLYCATALCGWLLVDDAAAFRPFYLAHVLLSGAYFTAASSLPMELFPRAEFVRYNAGKDVVVTLGGILVSACQGPLLDWSGHAYRLTLVSGALFSLLCVGCMVRLMRAPAVDG